MKQGILNCLAFAVYLFANIAVEESAWTFLVAPVTGAAFASFALAKEFGSKTHIKWSVACAILSTAFFGAAYLWA